MGAIPARGGARNAMPMAAAVICCVNCLVTIGARARKAFAKNIAELGILMRSDLFIAPREDAHSVWYSVERAGTAVSHRELDAECLCGWVRDTG